MGYRDRITPEVDKWLTDIRNAYTPWLSKPASDAPRWLLGTIGLRVALPGLEAAFQCQRLTLTRVRRAVATVATSRKRLELEIGQLEQQASEPNGQNRAGREAGQSDTEEQLADLRRQYADLQAKEERVKVASRRLQAEINNFHAAKDAIEVAYTATEEAARAAWAEVTGNADADAGGSAGGSTDFPS